MGIILNLDKIPTREENIVPYELLLSESQERMLIVAKAGHEEEVKAIFARWDLQAEVVGHVTNDGLFRTQWHGEEGVRIPVSALTDDAPVYDRPIAPQQTSSTGSTWISRRFRYRPTMAKCCCACSPRPTSPVKSGSIANTIRLSAGTPSCNRALTLPSSV